MASPRTMAETIAISSFPQSEMLFFDRVNRIVFAPRTYFHLGSCPILINVSIINWSSSEALPVKLNGSTDSPGTVSRILLFDNPPPKSTANSASVPRTLI